MNGFPPVFSHSVENYLSLVLQGEAGKQDKSAQATLSNMSERGIISPSYLTLDIDHKGG